MIDLLLPQLMPQEITSRYKLLVWVTKYIPEHMTVFANHACFQVNSSDIMALVRYQKVDVIDLFVSIKIRLPSSILLSCNGSNLGMYLACLKDPDVDIEHDDNCVLHRAFRRNRPEIAAVLLCHEGFTNPWSVLFQEIIKAENMGGDLKF